MELEVTTPVAGTIRIGFTSQRAWADWEQFANDRLDVHQALAHMMRRGLVDDIDRDFIRIANAAGAGQPDRNDDILMPVTPEIYAEGMRRLRDNPPGVNEPAMLINPQLRRHMQEDGVYRQIMPPIPLSELDAALDRQAVEAGALGIRAMDPAAVFAVVVADTAMTLAEYIGWPTPRTGLRAVGLVVQDAHGAPNTLSSGQENSAAP